MRSTPRAPGANSGRAGSQGPVGVDCVTSKVPGDEAAQKATATAFAFMSDDGKSIGWSCSISDKEDTPVFRIESLVPTILGQAESPAGKSTSWSFGESNSGVSIVPRSAGHSESWHVACAGKEPRKAHYDLAVLRRD